MRCSRRAAAPPLPTNCCSSALFLVSLLRCFAVASLRPPLLAHPWAPLSPTSARSPPRPLARPISKAAPPHASRPALPLASLLAGRLPPPRCPTAPRFSPRTLGHQKPLPTQASTPGAVQHLEPPVPLPRVPPRNLHPARSSRPSLRDRPPHLAPLARPWRTRGTPLSRASRRRGRAAAPLRAPLGPPRRLRRRRRPRTSARTLGSNA